MAGPRPFFPLGTDNTYDAGYDNEENATYILFYWQAHKCCQLRDWNLSEEKVYFWDHHQASEKGKREKY